MSKSSSSCPRVALIGVSGYGRVHLQLVLECRAQGLLRLTAAVVINPEEEAEVVRTLRDDGCQVYADYDSMLTAEAGRIDLCLVPTGIHWHARMTIAALASGANVLVEKPLCPTMAEVAQIEAAERKYQRFVAVGFQDLYEPGTQWLKRQLVAGAIGEVQSVRFLGLWPRARLYFQRNNWAGRLSVGGQTVLDSPLSNAFAHFVMLSLYFADPHAHGAAAAEILDAELYRAHQIESFDTGVVRSRTSGGTELWFGVTHACQSTLEPVIEIKGSAGVAGWRYEQETWVQRRGGEKQVHPLLSVNGARQHMMAAVLRRLQNPAESICEPALAARHTAFIEALHALVPIKAFDRDMVDWGDDPDAVTAVPFVRGLESAVREAHAGGSPLSAANASWSEVS